MKKAFLSVLLLISAGLAFATEGHDGGNQGGWNDHGSHSSHGDHGGWNQGGNHHGSGPVVGPVGPEGPQGPQGDQGAPGPQGAKGDKGDTGAQGVQGVQGAKGDTGLQGATGAVGANGADGLNGANGNDGAKGETGAQGAQGKQGEQGIQGVQGLAGRDADTSKLVTKDQFRAFKKDTYGGLASVLAVAGLPQPTAAGKTMVSAGVANYHGQQGFAIGVSRVTTDERFVLKGGVSTSTRGDFGAVVSGGYQF